MPMTHQRADATLTAALLPAATPHVWLHVGSPGIAGTANVAQAPGPVNIVRKPVTFGAIGNHATNIERRTLSSSNVSWSGAEILVGQNITHISIWSALSAGTPEFISTVAVAKTTGSDGVLISVGDLEVAIGVFVRP